MTDPITPPAAPEPVVPPVPAPTPNVAVIPPTPTVDMNDGQKMFPAEYVQQLRAEAASRRVEGEQLRTEMAEIRTAAEQAAVDAAERAKQELTQSWGKALGFVTDDAPVDPQVLLEQAKAAQAAAEQREAEAARATQAAVQQAKAAQVEAELFRRATTAGADPVALIDSRTFMQRADVQALDPTAADFASQVDAVIRNAVDADPRYRAGRVAVPRSGGDHAAGNGDPASGSSTASSVQAFMDEKFKAMTGGRGGKIHSRFLRGSEHGETSEPMLGQ